MAVNDRDYALVVGINDYPSFRPLRGAIADAAAVETWLTDTTVGGGLAPAQCRKVVSAPNPLRPIQDDIDDALKALVDRARSSGGGRRFYFYFSGHGLGSGPDTALCLAKWSEDFRLAALESSTYTQYVKETGLFSEIIMIMDCCRVRKVNVRGLQCTLGGGLPSPSSGRARMFTAHATEALAQSFETEVTAATAAAGPEVRGHFTRALLEALYGAAADPAGGVSASSLKQYLERETPVIAGDAGHDQKPEVVDGLPSAGVTFGSATPISQVSVTFEFAPGRAGVIDLEDAKLNKVQSAPAGDRPRWSNVPLESALHSLHDLATGERKTFRVRPVLGVFDVKF